MTKKFQKITINCTYVPIEIDGFIYENHPYWERLIKKTNKKFLFVVNNSLKQHPLFLSREDVISLDNI